MDYYQGYEDAIRQARVSRTSGLIGFIARTIFSILYGAFVYVPLFLVGYWLANKMTSLYSGDIVIKIGLTVAWAYVSFAFVYFLKGVLIGLRTGGRMAWIVIWMLCVFVTAGAQSLISQSIFETFFSARNIANYQIWSWLGAASVALLIYSHYQFLTNVAPR